jgi:exodeoxyribonuclease V alpha subunit
MANTDETDLIEVDVPDFSGELISNHSSSVTILPGDVVILANMETRHQRKDAGSSRYERQCDGTINTLYTIKGELPAKKAKPMAISFADEFLDKIFYLKKGTKLQLSGHVEELTRQQDVFRVTNFLVPSPFGAQQLIQGLYVDPQQKRNEAVNNDGFKLSEEIFDSCESVESQEIMSISALLANMNFCFDYEVAYAVYIYFKRRARIRGYDDVKDMIETHPLVLAELNYLESIFSLKNVIEGAKAIGSNDLTNKAKLYAAIASELQRSAQRGESFLPLTTLCYNQNVTPLLDLLCIERRERPQYVTRLAIQESKLSSSPYARIIPESMKKDGMDDYIEPLKDSYRFYYERAHKTNITNRLRTLEKTGMYLAKCFSSEKYAAELMADRLGVEPLQECLDDVESIVDDIDSNQRNAIIRAFNYKVSCITGGAGTGKTRTIAQIVRIAQAHGMNSLILAPSAKAALGAASGVGMTDLMYQTIHRCATILPEDEDRGETRGESHNENSSLATATFVIIDEMSMCTLPMFAKLLRTLENRPSIRLVLVGDTEQLPAIGPHFFHQITDNVLQDYMPVTRLEHNYRAEGNVLASFAENIRNGSFLIPQDQDRVTLCNMSFNEFVEAYPELAADQNTLFLASRKRDIDVMNVKLREIRLEGRAERIGDTLFYLEDPVISIRNDYSDPKRTAAADQRHPDRDVNVYNGTEGVIVSADPEEDTVMVRLFSPDFPDGEQLVPYTFKEISVFFTPAYAITVHKAQGCQADKVVFFAREGRVSKNMLYTAVTRAANELVLVGDQESFELSMESPYVPGRTRFAFKVLNNLREKDQDTEDPEELNQVIGVSRSLS